MSKKSSPDNLSDIQQFFDSPTSNSSDIEQYFDSVPTEQDSSLADKAMAVHNAISFGVGKAVQTAAAIGPALLSLADTLPGDSTAMLHRTVGYDPKQLNKEIGDAFFSKDYKDVAEGLAAQKGIADTAKYAVTHPSTIAGEVIAAVPTMLAGGAIGRALTGAGAAADLLAPVIGEGLMSTGSTASQIQQDQGYKELTPGQSLLALGSGAVVGGLGYGGGKLAEKLGIADMDVLAAGGSVAATEAKRGVLARLLGGMVSEGLIEEAPQSAIEQIAQNVATGKEWSVGVAEASTMGAIVGGLMGGATSAATKPQASEEEILQKVAEHAIDKADMLTKLQQPEPVSVDPLDDELPSDLITAIDDIELNPITEEERAAAKEEEAAPEAVNPDMPRLHEDAKPDVGKSIESSQSRMGEVNPNNGVPLNEQIVTIGEAHQKDKPLSEVRLTPGKAIGVGEASDLYPQAYREAVVRSAEQLMAKLGLSAKLVISFETLPEGKTAAVRPLGNGAYAINPANLTRFGDTNKMNEVSKLEAAYSLPHELGHVLTWEEIQGGMLEEHRKVMDTLGTEELFTDEFLAQQRPEVQAVFAEYNALKQRVLDGSMTAREFLNLWLGPAKAGRGISTKDKRQTFGQAMAGEFTNFESMSAKQFVKVMGEEILNPHEYLGEQLARYAHDKKLLEQTSLGTQQFFGRVLTKLREFFKHLKKEKMVKAGTAFTDFVDAMVERGQIGGRSSKIKAPRKAKAATIPKPPKIVKPLVGMKDLLAKTSPSLVFPQTEQEIHDAKQKALSIVQKDLGFLKAKNRDAYMEALALARTGQFEELRGLASNYVESNTSETWKFSSELPPEDRIAEHFQEPDWKFAITDFLQEKAPESATVEEWEGLFASWLKQGKIKLDDYNASGLDAFLFLTRAPKVSKGEIIQRLEEASGPLKMVVLEEGSTTYHDYIPQEFKGQEYKEFVFDASTSQEGFGPKKHYLDRTGAQLGWVRAVVLRDRGALFIQEIQSDIGQAFPGAAPDYATRYEMTEDGTGVLLYAENKLVGAKEAMLEDKLYPHEIIERFNQELMLKSHVTKNNMPHATSTQKWAGVMLRAVQRWAADQNLNKIILTSGELQVKQWGTDEFGVKDGVFSAIVNGRSMFLSGSTEGELAADLAFKLALPEKQNAKVARELWANRAKESYHYAPRRAGFDSFYGASGGSDSILRSVLKAQPGIWKVKDVYREAVPEVERSLSAFDVRPEWRGKAVQYFSTAFPENSPEFEQLTKQVERVGAIGEAQLMPRRIISYAQRFTRAVATIQQLAFAKGHIAGLQYQNKIASDYQAYRSRLEVLATNTAQKWGRLGKEQNAKLQKFLQAEYEEGQHWAELVPTGKRWKFEVSKTFAEKASEYGLTEHTARIALEVKQSMLQHTNAMETLLSNKALRRYKAGSPALRVRLSEIRNTFAAIRTQPFLPQSRFGEFGVQVFEYTPDGEQLVHQEFFQTEGQRDEALGLLQKKVGKMTHRVEARNWRGGASMLKGISPELLATVSRELDLTEGQQGQLLAMLDRAKENRAARSFSRELSKVTGRNRDLLRNFADFMQHDSSLLAKLRYREEFNRACQSVENDIKELDLVSLKDAEYLEKRRELEAVLQYMQEHRDYLMNPQNEMQAIKAMIVLWQLWGVAKSALANLTQFVVLIADATANWGEIRGGRQVVKATAKISAEAIGAMMRTGKRLLRMQVEQGKVLTEDERWAVERAEVNGLLDQTFTAQLANFSNAGVLQRLTGSQVNNYVQFTKRMGMMPQHLVELFMRRIAFLTKFNLYREAGLEREKAYEYAAEETRLTMGDSSRINRAPFMRGKAANFTIYYNFTQLMMYMFSGQYEKNAKQRSVMLNEAGYDVPVRHLSIGGMTGRMWLMFAILGGAAGAPGEEDLRAILRLVAQKVFGTDFDIDLELRKLVKQFNDSAEDWGIEIDPNMLMHGVSHNIAGFDLSGSVGFGKVIPGLATLGDSGSEPMDTALAAAGPLGGFVSGLLRALSEENSNLALRIAPALPTVVRNAVQALDWSENGVKFRSGGLVVRDLETDELRDLSTGELIGKGVGGFSPTVVTQNREQHYAQSDAVRFWEERGKQLMANMAEAALQNDREALADVTKAFADYNSKCPPGMQLRRENVIRSIQGRSRAAALDTAGVAHKKSERPAAQEVKELFKP